MTIGLLIPRNGAALIQPNLFLMALWLFGKYEGADVTIMSTQHCLSCLVDGEAALDAAMYEMLGVIGTASHMAGGRSSPEQAVWYGDTRVKTGKPKIFSMCKLFTYLTYSKMQIALFMRKTHVSKLASTITAPISN